EIYKAFCAITHPITGVQDTNKIVLQISYGSTQWQVQDGKVLNAKPYTPTYDKIYERLRISDTQAIYDEQYQNPYAVYEQNDVKNIIWYENNKSVQAKIDLAKLFGIQGVSYWRLGTIPQYE
ncbi:MAG: glycosyl hydrolase family 18 protein, partial [Niameybacter sp.]